MDKTCTPYKVNQCSKCAGDTEYHCVSCFCDLCDQCKENHVKDSKTMQHKIVLYSQKLKCIPKQDMCFKHPNNVCRKYCEPCQAPVCDFCSDHKPHRFPSSLFRKKQHKIVCIPEAYKTKQKQVRGTINKIRNEVLFSRSVLLTEMLADIRTTMDCHTDSNFFQSGISAKAHRLKQLIENVAFGINFKHTCLKQKIEMYRHIASIERYEQTYDQRSFSPLQYLLFMKKESFPPTQITLHTSKLSMIESINMEDVMESLSAIQITEKGKSRAENGLVLKMLPALNFEPGPRISPYLKWTKFGLTEHMSYVTSEEVWVSYKYNLMAANVFGYTLQNLKD